MARIVSTTDDQDLILSFVAIPLQTNPVSDPVDLFFSSCDPVKILSAHVPAQSSAAAAFAGHLEAMGRGGKLSGAAEMRSRLEHEVSILLSRAKALVEAPWDES